jgi:hypothetical protein
MSKKLYIKLQPLIIDELEGVSTQEVWERINQIIFVINELNITIYEDDEGAKEKWKDFLR